MTDVRSFMDSEGDGICSDDPLSVSEANRNHSRFLFKDLKHLFHTKQTSILSTQVMQH